MKQMAILFLPWALVLGCAGNASEPYGLELTDAAASGGFLHVGLVQDDGTPVIADEWAPIDLPMDVTYDALAPGTSYTLHVYEDVDDSGTCSSPDRAWRVDLPPVGSPVHVALDAATPDPGACAYFNP
jgi:hypothetical protein